MKAITLYQPQASAVALGLKRNETRNRLTHYRGDLAICSAKRQPDNTILTSAVSMLWSGRPDKCLPLGVILCVVEIWGCIPTEEIVRSSTMTHIELCCGDYGRNRFAWLTRNVRLLETPIPVKGKQGFFNLPPDIAIQVAQQIPVR